MNILMINKFLHPNGGSETYIFRLGQVLAQQGHRVEYFGMDHPDRCVGNRVDAYTSTMDFHGGSKLSKLLYPIRTVYSTEARRKLRLVLEDLQPDVCHLNNFNYQLTPSIILEIRKWEKQSGHKVKILYTAHDYQLVCPNHMCNRPLTHSHCEKCLHGSFIHCLKGKCIHGSTAKSAIGMAEAMYWNGRNVYEQIDVVICPSRFMKTKLDTNPVFARKTVVLLNFIQDIPHRQSEKQDYVLYLGRMSGEKGIDTLQKAAKALSHIPFIFAGSGSLDEVARELPNVTHVGFQKGDALAELICNARFSVYPSRWYENCPFSVMESLQLSTPVVGANIGGIPELIEHGVTGELFESGNAQSLTQTIQSLWDDSQRLARYTENCHDVTFDTAKTYCRKLLELYTAK